MQIISWIIVSLFQCIVAAFVLLQCSGKKKKDAEGKKDSKKADSKKDKTADGKKAEAKKVEQKPAEKKKEAKLKEAKPIVEAAAAAKGGGAKSKGKSKSKTSDAAGKPAKSAEAPKSQAKQLDKTQRTEILAPLPDGEKISKQLLLEKTQSASVKDDPKVSKSTKSDKPSIISSKTANPKGDPKEVKVEPEKLNYKTGEEKAKLKIENVTDKPLAMKLKCSDNEIYTFKPVFFLLKPKEAHEHEVIRKKDAKAKVDKMLVVYTEAKDGVTAKKVFEAKPTAKEISIGLVAT